MNIESTTVLNTSLRSAFQAATTYPLFVRQYQEKEILEDDGTNFIVQIGYRVFGVWIRWKGKGIRTPYTLIEYEQVEGLLKGLRAIWSFSGNGDQTLFRLTVSLSLKGCPLKRCFSPFFYLLIASTVKKIANGLEEEVAKCQSNPLS